MDMNYIFYMADCEGLLDNEPHQVVDYEDILDECGVEQDELSDPEARYCRFYPF